MGKQWTDKEIKKLKSLCDDGFTSKEIAEKLTRPVGSVRAKLKNLNKKPKSNVSKEHLYQVGEVVNKTLKIMKQTRVKSGRRTCKGYVVKSLAYPDDKNDYEVAESVLKVGCGCAYITGQRICEENSLWSIKEIRKHIRNEDVEYSKSIAPSTSRTELYFVCNDVDCDYVKKMTPNKLTGRGFLCKRCSRNLSYGQLAFGQYQEYNKLKLESEKTLPRLGGRRADFINFETGMWVEIQGVQHTDTNHKWYEEAHEQDLIKREFANNNTQYNLIEIDMRISSWDYFKEQINKCEYLPNITDDDEIKILKLMEQNKRYPIEEIIDFYERGETLVQLGKRYKVSDVTIGNILEKNNVEIRSNGKQVRCITTGEIFETVAKAREWALKGSKIDMACRGQRNYAGVHPITGEKLAWEYVTHAEMYINYKAKRLAQSPSINIKLDESILILP